MRALSKCGRLAGDIGSFRPSEVALLVQVLRGSHGERSMPGGGFNGTLGIWTDHKPPTGSATLGNVYNHSKNGCKHRRGPHKGPKGFKRTEIDRPNHRNRTRLFTFVQLRRNFRHYLEFIHSTEWSIISALYWTHFSKHKAFILRNVLKGIIQERYT